jgi:hypothetical protein
MTRAKMDSCWVNGKIEKEASRESYHQRLPLATASVRDWLSAAQQPFAGDLPGVGRVDQIRRERAIRPVPERLGRLGKHDTCGSALEMMTSGSTTSIAARSPLDCSSAIVRPPLDGPQNKCRWKIERETYRLALEGGVVDATDAKVDNAGSCTEDLALRSPDTEGDRDASRPIGGRIGRVSAALLAAFA